MKKIIFIFSAVLIGGLFAIINNHYLKKSPDRILSQVYFQDRSQKVGSLHSTKKYNNKVPNTRSFHSMSKTKESVENKPGKSFKKTANTPVRHENETTARDKNSKITKSTPLSNEDISHLTDHNENGKSLADSNIKELNTNNKYAIAVERIIQQFQKDGDKEKAFNALVEIKDELTGEDLQSALKQMHLLGDAGGNTVLIDTFLNPYNQTITDLDRVRALTYINPDYKLSETQIESIYSVYFNEVVQGASDAILMTISQAGGDVGAQLLIEIIDSEINGAKYTHQITALGYSDSPVAFDYLNQKLNELVQVETEEQDTELINLIRNLILQNNSQ